MLPAPPHQLFLLLLLPLPYFLRRSKRQKHEKHQCHFYTIDPQILLPHHLNNACNPPRSARGEASGVSFFLFSLSILSISPRGLRGDISVRHRRLPHPRLPLNKSLWNPSSPPRESCLPFSILWLSETDEHL